MPIECKNGNDVYSSRKLAENERVKSRENKRNCFESMSFKNFK